MPRPYPIEVARQFVASQTLQVHATHPPRAVIHQAFTVFAGLHKVRALADARNIGAERVMEKLSTKREGVLRQNRYSHGEFVDEVWYGVLRNEWMA